MSTTDQIHVSDAPAAASWLRAGLIQFFAGYFWFILKNVIGWTLILTSGPIGFLIPGPVGFPLFFIGFVMVTIPGKRRLTARMMYGRPLQLQARLFTGIAVALSLIVPGLLAWYLAVRFRTLEEDWRLATPVLVLICIVAVGATWVVSHLLLRALNGFLRTIPRMRRRVRPWLRRRGIHLLPPRRRRQLMHRLPGDPPPLDDQEIFEIHARHHRRLKIFWSYLRPWLNRAVGVGITVAIFAWIFIPIVEHWDQVREPILATSPLRFILAAGMFAVFLFVFRVLSWRRILSGFGHRLPLSATTRIWSTSELARYLPGAIWQVLGRIYLLRPYGINAVVSSASQALELTIFLLGNLLLAIFCLFWFGAKMADESRYWLWIAIALVPMLLVLLHPAVFYGVMNRIVRALKGTFPAERLPGRAVPGLLGWAILGLIWQSVAVWLLMSPVLGLDWSHLWLVAGAYSLAWCAGFLAFWAPGGIGVRELVLITTMQFALPEVVYEQATVERETFLAFLAFVSVLLRLWATAGELALATIAHLADFRGALGQPDAPGRTRLQPVETAEE